MVVDRVKNNRAGLENKRKRRSLRLLAILIVGAAVMPTTGCTAWTGAKSAWQYNGYWNEGIMGFRHSCMASKAWHSRKHAFANQQYLKDFARGFRAGYMEVADGGDGCTPAFAPREYWGWKYQSCEGQARVAAWFAGFPHGAQAAEQDGIGGWTQIQTSSGIQNEYTEHGLMPEEYNGMYPVPKIQPGFDMLPPKGEPTAEVIESSILDMNPYPTGNFDPQYTGELPIVPVPDPTIQ